MLECNYIRQAIDLLEGLIPKRDDNKDISRDHLEKLIVFAIIWSLGALLEQTDRKKVRYRGSYMRALLLLIFLNELRKRDKMWGLPSILSLFCNKFNKFSNTGAWMIDSFYHITLELFCNDNIGVKTSRFCHIYKDHNAVMPVRLETVAPRSHSRVLDSRLMGSGFEPHRRHCFVVLEQDTFILA